ncbi:MAG: HDOD domain-containing protein [Pirellulales bacterium]|nr:HDOD domain-containing protein [Pirellulales bacterium]
MNSPTHNAKLPLEAKCVDAIDEMIARVGALHSSPDVAQSLLRLTKTPDYDVQAVVACLEKDPVMCAKVLRLVNSSRYAIRREIKNLQQAVTFLGQKTLRLVSMTFSLVDTLTRGAPRELFNDYWQRSITTATVSARLAKLSKDCDAGDAYAAGLLADLGVLLFAQAVSKDYCSIYHKAKTEGTSLVETEQAQFGFDHAMLGAKLLSDWGFPDDLIDAVLSHHDGSCANSAIAAAAHGGSLMTDVIWNLPSASVVDVMRWLDEHFGVNIDEFIDLALNTRDEIQTEAEIFGVSLHNDVDVQGLRSAVTEQFKDAAGTTERDLDELVAKFDVQNGKASPNS